MELFTLKGRVAVVTGGNGGIGLGIAKGLASAGASIVVAARDADKNEAAIKELEVFAVKAMAVETDVRKLDSCQSMFDQATASYGGVDILVNNAGMNIRQQPQEYDLDAWNTVMETNLTSAMLCSKFAHPIMKQRGGGKIINIGSMMSIFGAPFASAYAASKGGMVQFTKACASAWAADNIQVNAIAPNYVESPTYFPPELVNDAEALAKMTRNIPLKRLGRPEEVAALIAFYASDQSDFITGHVMPFAGGWA